MKKILILIFIISSVYSQAFAQKPVVTLANGEWEPYLSKNLVHQGFASHVVSRAFEIYGIDVQYKWYDSFWKRAYKDAKDGVVNGSLVWSKKPEREIEMFFSDPVFEGKRDVFFYLKKNPFSWDSIDDLKGKIFGGTIGYNYGESFEDAEKQGLFKVVRIKNDVLNFKALLLGRMDAFIAGEKAGYKALNENFSKREIEQVTHHKKPIRVSTYHLILSRQILENRDLIKAFNYGLQELKKSGEYDEMLKNFEKGFYSEKKS
jgi:polar amino acid transport system substrate-binding protein